MVAPSSSNTSDTVVEVGNPQLLKVSSTKMSLAITAMKMVITSRKVKCDGCITPCRAMSIMPFDISAPSKMPQLATNKMVLNVATREPMAEFRKFTASLLTPTNKSKIANRHRLPTINKRIKTVVPIYSLFY